MLTGQKLSLRVVVKSGFENVKRELESNVDNLDSSLTKTVSNGNPLNGLEMTGKDGNNGIVSNLMNKASQGGKSIKTFIESPVKKLLDPATALEAGQSLYVRA